ncbi:4'-phosphopantetheinyl transferase family protein [Rubrolithibacter danxiaensis]|uniref:4'-phosphopantetheinyl transferase family protein n=1 Tax=Rubrolithibacter danxiaensis TaxID=3390805 RepID=UPI003BF83B4A
MSLVYRKELDKTTAFGLWKIEETEEELLSQLQLKEHETDYLETLNGGKRHLHWLSTRVLLRKMLGDPAYIDCRIDEHGKPFLTNFPYHISLSHSFEYAAVMISEDKEVGIDIEQIRNKIEKIANKFMTDAELEFICEEQRTHHLYICWCAKEAVYKLQGKRNVSFKDHIHLKPFPYTEKGKFEARLESTEDNRTFDVYFERFEDYMIGYCAAEKV